MSILNSISGFFDDLTTSRRHAAKKKPVRSTSPTHLPFYTNGHPQSSSTSTLPSSRPGTYSLYLPLPVFNGRVSNASIRTEFTSPSATGVLGSALSLHASHFHHRPPRPLLRTAPRQILLGNPTPRTQSKRHTAASARAGQLGPHRRLGRIPLPGIVRSIKLPCHGAGHRRSRSRPGLLAAAGCAGESDGA